MGCVNLHGCPEKLLPELLMTQRYNIVLPGFVKIGVERFHHLFREDSQANASLLAKLGNMENEVLDFRDGVQRLSPVVS